MAASVLDHIQLAGLPTKDLEPGLGGAASAPGPTYDVDFRMRTIPSGIPYTAFGELSTAEKTPQLQRSFDTHIDPIDWELTTSGDVAASQGTVTMARGQACVSTNGKAGGGAQMESTEYAWYHPGQGIVVQFSGEWTNGGAVGNESLIGYGNASNGLFFGYNGAQFGVLLRSNESGSVVDTWIPQTEWNTEQLIDNDANKTGFALDPTKANVYIIRAQLHYQGRIIFYVVSPEHDIPIPVHIIKHNDQTTTGVTLRTASLPLHISTQNAAGVTTELVAHSASMAVFIEGREREGRRKFSYGLSRLNITTEEHIATFRMRESIMGETNHGHALIYAINTGTTGNRPGFIRVYKNVKVFGTDLTYANHHLCSLLDQATDDTTLGATLTGTSSAVVGDPPYQFDVSGVDGSSNRLAGCILHVSGSARRILTSSGSSPATVTVAALENAASTYDNKSVTIYNGEHIFTQALGKDSSTTNVFEGDMLIHLSPGDSITVTAESSAAAEMWISLSWIEKL